MDLVLHGFLNDLKDSEAVKGCLGFRSLTPIPPGYRPRSPTVVTRPLLSTTSRSGKKSVDGPRSYWREWSRELDPPPRKKTCLNQWGRWRP